jgi:2-dehydro-3-deoxyphosphogluconate aldolase/(4S)-4-hydroxy-2-oxoglutarate aldolase
MMDIVLEKIGELGIVPVVKIDRLDDTDSLCHALLDGDLPCAEITFRTDLAAEAIAIAVHYTDLLVGAGTVLTLDQAKRAVEAGARFIVSPGFNTKIVDWCLENAIPVTPGVATPTEINLGLERNLSVLKFFPANILGGVAGVKAIAAAYPGIRFIPTGGINPENLKQYLNLPYVHACGGSWIAKSELITSGQFTKITELARQAREIALEVKGDL